MKKAFTLIELLVVVLIIGILAAIALPKYEKAVHKARFAENIVRAKTYKDAIDLYLLENGFPSSGTVDLGEINPDLVAGLTGPDEYYYKSKYQTVRIACNSSPDCQYEVDYLDGNGTMLVQFGGFISPTRSWLYFCFYEDDIGKFLCSQFADREDFDIEDSF